MFDIAIIGAGVVGGFVARELSKYNLKIVLLEKMGDVAMGATRANSAIVHAGFDAKEGSLKAKLNVRGSDMMEGVARELGVKYSRCGSIVVGFSEEDRKTLLELKERGEKNGVRELSVVSRDELLKIEKNIGEGVTSALIAPTGAIICPYELCMAAVGNAMDNGARLMLDFDVRKIEKIGEGYEVFSENKSVKAKIVINCAGIYSDEIARMVGDDSFSVKARRGEYMLLDKECGGLVSHTVFRCPSKMGKGILVSPTVDGNLILGPTAEDIDDKEDTRTTAEGLDSVRRQAAEQVSGINFGKAITSFTGLRSTGSTGDFIINIKDGFVNVAGIESPGLSSAPAIAEYVAELIAGEGSVALEKRDDFNPVRRPAHYFRELSIDEKNEVIKNDPAFAHVICRCEIVTEGEILEAIRTNPKPRDVDGVKRRTRASMGRCQGGFCTPYIIELLSSELGCDYDKVTKFGGESYINLGKTKEIE
ncbi:MAG: NAD(P)/FAD-dependent oxidoreductase [Ruminococcaceae bacterium]|nr:NAD(P)/FAD-dependent oxidoreductase [Oscillospiraceae bacterium]